MDQLKIPGGFDQLFRQVTPLFLLGLIGVNVFEPWIPGGDWLRENLGDDIVLRASTIFLAMYVLLLWGESLRLNTILTGVLKAFREYGGEAKASTGAKNPKARLEAAKLLIAALASDEKEIRETSRHNLGRLVGKDLGAEPGPWREWLAEQERSL